MKIALMAAAYGVMVTAVHGWMSPQEKDPAALIAKLNSKDADDAENARLDLLRLGEAALGPVREAAAKEADAALKKKLLAIAERLEIRKAVATLAAKGGETWHSLYIGALKVGWVHLKTESKDGRLLLTDEIFVQTDKNNLTTLKISVACLPDEYFSVQEVSYDMSSPDRTMAITARVKEGRLVVKEGEQTKAQKVKANLLVDTAFLRLVTILPKTEGYDLTVLQLVGEKPKFRDNSVVRFDKEDSVEHEGRQVKCRRFILSDGEDNDRSYWVDAEGRLLKIQIRADEKDAEIVLTDEKRAKDIDTKD